MTVAAAVGGVTMRALVGRRRILLMLLVALLPILLGLLSLAQGANVLDLGGVLELLVIANILPLVALVIGTAALGSELEDGTGVHLLTKPVARWVIVGTKIVVASTLTALLIVPSTIVGGILIGGAEPDAVSVSIAYGAAALVGSFTYTAIFVALSAITTRGLLIGLAYIVLWEGLLAGLLPGTVMFSVRAYLVGIAETIEPTAASSEIGAAGLGLAIGVAVGAFLVASFRLARFEVRGAE